MSHDAPEMTDLEYAKISIHQLVAKHGIAELLRALADEVQAEHVVWRGRMRKQERHELATIKLRDALTKLASSKTSATYDDWGV